MRGCPCLLAVQLLVLVPVMVLVLVLFHPTTAFQLPSSSRNNNQNNYHCHNHHHHHHRNLREGKNSISSYPTTAIYSTTPTFNNKINDLPSAYDKSLPASLRGEAVRSALKSDRGVCLDFTTTSTTSTSIGLVKITGTTVANYLNSKLSTSFPTTKTTEASLTSTSRNDIENDNGVKLEYGFVKEAGLITSKGRLIDKLTVLYFYINGNGKESPPPSSSSSSLEAYLMTSPGHAESMLFNRLDPFIFPLDGVKLIDMCPTTTTKSTTKTTTKVFTILSTKLENVQSTILKNIIPIIQNNQYITLNNKNLNFVFPKYDTNECLRYTLSSSTPITTNSNSINNTYEILIHPQTFLPKCCCYGYTISITSNHDNGLLASQIWNHMIDLNNMDGPVELGPLEYETLRIEAGVAAFRHEITGGLTDDNEDDDVDDNNRQVFKANASPLELHLHHIIDETKGCYQGQEAISAQLNNKKGPPRTLYNIIFPEEDNFYDFQKNDEEEYSNHSQRLLNKTTLPKVGDDIYVLGSNSQIKVGALTSVAEKDGTSMSETVALGLVRRSESILKRMSDMGLEISRDEMFEEDPFWSEGSSSSSLESGIIKPLPLDPLDGLEVVIGDSFTQGYLRQVPSLRLMNGQNMFEIDSWSQLEFQEETGSVMGFIPQNDIPLKSESVKKAPEAEVEPSVTINNEKDTVQEARRKAEKLKLLKQRAEEAITKRQQKKEAENYGSDSASDENSAEVEAERKEKKIKMLKERAEAAMKRRRENKQ